MMVYRMLRSVRRRRGAFAVALVAVAGLVAGCIAAVQLAPRPSAPTAQAGTAVPVRVVHGRPVQIPAMKASRRPVTSWPAADTATVALKVPERGGRLSADPAAGSARAGSSPVWIGPADTGGTTATTTAATTPAGYGGLAGVSRARVSVASQQTARTLGVRGVVLSVARADGTTGAGRVHVSVSYTGFENAFGGDYGARLRLVQLPACALTTPAVAACHTQTPLGSLNDARRDWVGADVTLPATSSTASDARDTTLTSAVRTSAVVLAVEAGPSGSAGNFAAEPLSEADTSWVNAASSGAYTYNFPVTAPPVPGGLEPDVSLGYDSQATSGLTSSTNNDASWVGTGWTYSPGFIETDYTTCSADAGEPGTGDLCPNGETVSMSLNGQTTTLVDGSGTWAAESDGGETIKQSGTSWEVIEPDGTQYWFGLNKLPGYASGDPVTNSVWDVPVWEGCDQAALCELPWRYNLDYEVDPHDNAIAYFYNTQTNYYAEQDGTTGTGAYTQGGVLTSIEYGLRAGQVYTSTPAAEITFTSAAGRQDAPTDLTCAQGAACDVNSPTFWTNDSLTTITTQSLENGSLQDVDSYALATSYPVTNDSTTSPALWLDSVTQTGEDGSTPISLPPVTFGETPYANRVETSADSAAGYSDLTEYYLTNVTNDTGGVTSIAYSTPDPAPCATGTFPAPDASTAACYPDYWDPAGATTPVEDWFNLLTVASVTRDDTTGGEPPEVTSYNYTGLAWHYDAGTISRSATVTWDQYRGAQTVTTETGTEPDPITETSTTFLQGMSQNGPPADTGPVVTITTSQGQKVTDSDQFAGMQLEQIVYDGAGSGAEVTDNIDLPWTSSAIAVNNTLDQAAYITNTSSALTYTTLGTGGTRESITNYTYNSYGLTTAVSSVPDTSNAAEDTCSTTTYAANTGTWLIDLPATQSVYTEACNASGDGTGALVSETQDFYDGEGLGIAPTDGNLTKAEKATAAGYFDTTAYTYDEYGRVLTTTNPDEDITTNAYTPATGAEPTSVAVTDPMGLVTTTTYDPARDTQLTVTDPAGYVTTYTYDALGRKTAEWTPGNRTSGPATTTYSYTVSATAPSATTEQVEEPGGDYLITDTIQDSFGNTIEVQQETASGGMDVTDTGYNSDGWKTLDSGPYYTSGPPTGTLVEAAESSVPNETGYVYDSDGRVIRQICYDDGTEKWETDTSYGGNETTVTPPAGGTPETTWINGEGETTAIWQYHAGVPVSVSDPSSDYDATTYTYTPGQKLATITDANGDVWSYTYDLLGDELTETDPDSGTTTNTYDAAQRVITVTDARGKTIAYTYDKDGRKTAEYDTTGDTPESAASELASWTYDTLAEGQLTSTTAYEDGAEYTEAYTGYNSQGLPSGEETIIPSAQGALAGTYTQTNTYAPGGQETSYTDSAADGLPAETVTLGYNSAGEEDSLTGASPYVDSLSYTDLDQPLQYTMGTSSEPVYITDSYDPTTGDITQQNTQTGTAQTPVDDLNYTYNDVGDITSEADTPSSDPAATEVDCFEYDYLNRLVEAWAQGTAGCAASPSESVEGGAAPYWEAYTYNTIGDLTGITSTSSTGAVTTTADTYPSTGDAQPHAVTSQTVTGSSGTTSTSYSYDVDGNLISATGSSEDQSLTWNDTGQLTEDAVTASGGTAQDTTYTYDADGTLLITADPGTTTLYLPDEELSLDTSTGTVTGTRYYTIDGTTVAALTGATSLSYLIGDRQGTDSLAVNAATLALTRRYFDPYGNPLGTTSSGFPAGQKGFVGGAYDSATGLTDLGTREYQPGSGSFISADPILQPYDPQDLNAYTYSADNPTTYSDPTGAAPKRCPPGVEVCGNSYVQVGDITLPGNYPNVAQILNLYNEYQAHAPRVDTYPRDPEEQFRALYAVCQQDESVCGKQLTGLMIQAGPDGVAGAGNGVSPQSVAYTGASQLLANTVAISARLTGIQRNAAIGKMGEMATQENLEKLGYRVQAQVEFRTASGERAVIDFITLDGNDEYKGWEVKTGNGQLSSGQEAVYDALANGEDIYPVGENAEAIGLTPGVGVNFGMEFDLWDPPERW
jgi:RHS repeat-associated protein